MGFEPTPFRTGTLLQRLRPLGHEIFTDGMTLSHVYRRDVLDSAPEICKYGRNIVSVPTKAISRTILDVAACVPPPAFPRTNRSGALRRAPARSVLVVSEFAPLAATARASRQSSVSSTVRRFPNQGQQTVVRRPHPKDPREAPPCPMLSHDRVGGASGFLGISPSDCLLIRSPPKYRLRDRFSPRVIGGFPRFCQKQADAGTTNKHSAGAPPVLLRSKLHRSLTSSLSATSCLRKVRAPPVGLATSPARPPRVSVVEDPTRGLFVFSPRGCWLDLARSRRRTTRHRRRAHRTGRPLSPRAREDSRIGRRILHCPRRSHRDQPTDQPSRSAHPRTSARTI